MARHRSVPFSSEKKRQDGQAEADRRHVERCKAAPGKCHVKICPKYGGAK